MSVQIIEGRWYPLKGFGFEECCHCGLVHKIQYKLENGELYQRVWVDNKRTKLARKKLKVKLVPAK